MTDQENSNLPVSFEKHGRGQEPQDFIPENLEPPDESEEEEPDSE